MKSHKSRRLSIWKYFEYWIRDLILNRVTGPLTIRQIDRHLSRGLKELEAGFALAEHLDIDMLPALAGRLWRYGLRGHELLDRTDVSLERARELKAKLHGEPRQKKAKRGKALEGIVERKPD